MRHIRTGTLGTMASGQNSVSSGLATHRESRNHSLLSTIYSYQKKDHWGKTHTQAHTQAGLYLNCIDLNLSCLTRMVGLKKMTFLNELKRKKKKLTLNIMSRN